MKNVRKYVAEIILVVLGLVLAAGMILSAQSPGRAYSASTYGCASADNGSDPHPSDNHVVFWSSEGTAWPDIQVYITMFNPTVKPQRVQVRLKPDGFPVLVSEVLVPAGERAALLANELLASSGLSGRVNFATEVSFETLGAVSMATWHWDGANLSNVVYNTMVQGCEGPGWRNPYGL